MKEMALGVLIGVAGVMLGLCIGWHLTKEWREWFDKLL